MGEWGVRGVWVGDESCRACSEVFVEAAGHIAAEVPFHLDFRHGRGPRLHEAVHEKGTVHFLAQKLRAPERLFDFLGPDQHDTAHAERRKLRQKPLHDTRTRRGEEDVDPRRWRLVGMRTSYGDFSAGYCDNLRSPNRAIQFAGLESLADFSVQYFQNVFVKLNRDFRRRKTTKPEEWKDFSEVIRLCAANGFDLQCYIKYCFLNRLVPRSKGRTISDISYLKNTPQLMDYASNRAKIERLYSIYRSIQKTIFLVRKINKETDSDSIHTIKNLLSSKRLSTYLSTGTVSPYFVALIPKSAMMIHKIIDRDCEDCVTLIDFCNRIGRYGKDAIASLSMFYPNAMAKTVVEMCG